MTSTDSESPLKAVESDPRSRAEPASTDVDWKRLVSRQELDELLSINDGRAVLTLLVNWGLIFASFAAVGWRANPATILIALFVLGGRQLGCAVVMHEAAHRSLISNRAWNDRIGNWLGAYPIGYDVFSYRHGHLVHHAKTGTEADPVASDTIEYPVSARNLRKKIRRDLLGKTGWSHMRASLSGSDGRERRLRFLVTNAILLGLLSICGHPSLYLLWVAALFTTFRFALRVRTIAEHAMTGLPEAPLQNTRTTLVGFWERLILAPNFVNYHLEHHLLMTVPHYNLPKMHALLQTRGILDQAIIARGGYREVLRQAASGAPSS